MNLYAYVGNDPMNMVDPTGKWGAAVKALAETLKQVAKKKAKDEAKKQAKEQAKDGAKREGKRRKNRIPDKGEPNTVKENPAGTTRKKYNEDGRVEKEWNKGHGPKAPKNEQNDHIHDYKPNPNNPSGRGDRMPGRPARPRDLFDMDFFN